MSDAKKRFRLVLLRAHYLHGFAVGSQTVECPQCERPLELKAAPNIIVQCTCGWIMHFPKPEKQCSHCLGDLLEGTAFNTAFSICTSALLPCATFMEEAHVVKQKKPFPGGALLTIAICLFLLGMVAGAYLFG